MKWLSIWWYQYLFNGNTGIRNILCRAKCHPGGVVWYNFNPYNLEPDMHCNNCGEDLA